MIEWEGPAHYGWHDAMAGGPGLCEKAMRSKPESSVPWSLLQFLPHVPALSSFHDGLQLLAEINPFILKLLRNPTTDSTYGHTQTYSVTLFIMICIH